MIQIHAKGLSLSEDQEQKVREKMEKLLHLSRKVDDESTQIKVEIDYDAVKEKDKRIFCTVTIFAPGATLRAESHKERVESAADDCEAKLRVQIEKFKNGK